jgi:DNA-binding FadR family transcriptional regulator
MINRERRYPNRGIHGKVVQLIGRRIVSKERESGSALPEGELLAEFNVSRTVLREAVKVLAAKGLVESKPRTGTRVRPRGQWNLLDPDVLAWLNDKGLDERLVRNLAEVRRIVEPAAAELAAHRASEQEIHSLDEHYGSMEACVDDDEAFVEADMRWHFAILAASRNEILEQMNVAIGEALGRSRTITIELGSSAASLPLHKKVNEALRVRDAPAAKAAMEDLMVFVAEDIDRFFAGRSGNGLVTGSRGVSAPHLRRSPSDCA